MTGQMFDPTPTAPQMVEWLDLATRLQLERDLADLPTLAELLERNYFHLLARGDRDPRDSAVRYVTRFDALDLNDRRHKPEPSIDHEPRFGDKLDPAGLADLARRAGARRLGILPTLESWVMSFEADMLDRSVPHTDPILDATSTVTTAAGWLSRHLNWILGQQQVIELADEVRDIVEALDSLGVSLHGPDHAAVGTVNELAESTGISASSIYAWATNGWLTVVSEKRPRTYMRTEVLALYKAYGSR